MILLGDNLIPFEDLSLVDSIWDIEHSLPNSTLIYNYDENLLTYCNKNQLNSAIIVTSIKEAIYANALGAKYIISDKKLAKNIQKIAENYMFDSKILAIIEQDKEIEDIAQAEIDGVIYKDLLK
ncbi:hypothetical protein [Arcobacter sp. LA11]|uniref:hypothetical protein n=1 Tax=Arcobacter sp. LA11 TaxID=1898176 RepID=UPI00093501DA|nr:hypothetical protein [Arcobacter sp. LA11]